MLCDGASTTPLSTSIRVLYSPSTSATHEPLAQAESGAGVPGRPLPLVLACRAPPLPAAAGARRGAALRPSCLSAPSDGVASHRGGDLPRGRRSAGGLEGA